MKYEKPDGVIFVERVNDEWGYSVDDGPLFKLSEHNLVRAQFLAAKCDTVKRFSQMMRMDE